MKKFISILLALSMFTGITTPVFAEGAVSLEPNEGIRMLTDGAEADLTGAVSVTTEKGFYDAIKANTNAKIRIDGNIYLSNKQSIPSFNGEIHGQGYTLTLSRSVVTASWFVNLENNSLISNLIIVVEDMPSVATPNGLIAGNFRGKMINCKIKITPLLLNKPLFTTMEDNSVVSGLEYVNNTEVSDGLSVIAENVATSGGTYAVLLDSIVSIKATASTNNTISLVGGASALALSNSAILLNGMKSYLFKNFNGNSDVGIKNVDYMGVTTGLITTKNTMGVKITNLRIMPGSYVEELVFWGEDTEHGKSSVFTCYPYLSSPLFQTKPAALKALSIYEYQTRASEQFDFPTLDDKWTAEGVPELKIGIPYYEELGLTNRTLVELCQDCKKNCIVEKGKVCTDDKSHICKGDFLKPDKCLEKIAVPCIKCTDGCKATGKSHICFNNIVGTQVTEDPLKCECFLEEYSRKNEGKGTSLSPIEINDVNDFMFMLVNPIEDQQYKLIKDLEVSIGAYTARSSFSLSGVGTTLTVNKGTINCGNAIKIKQIHIVSQSKEKLFDRFNGTLERASITLNGGSFSEETRLITAEDVNINANGAMTSPIFGSQLELHSDDILHVNVKFVGSTAVPVLADTISGSIKHLELIVNGISHVSASSILTEDLQADVALLTINGNLSDVLETSTLIKSFSKIDQIVYNVLSPAPVTLFTTPSPVDETVIYLLTDNVVAQKSDKVSVVGRYNSDLVTSGLVDKEISTFVGAVTEIKLTPYENIVFKQFEEDTNDTAKIDANGNVSITYAEKGVYNLVLVFDINSPVQKVIRVPVQVTVEDVAAEDIEVQKDMSIKVGQTLPLVYKVLPLAATGSAIFTNHNEDIFKVEDDNIIGLMKGVGKLTLTVGDISKEVIITVEENKLQDVINLINKIPAEVTLQSEAVIREAYNAYVTLPGSDLAKMTQELTDKLLNAWKKIAELNIIKDEYDGFVIRLNSIPAIEAITIENGSIILMCSNHYDVMSVEARKLVTQEQITKLTSAKVKYDEIKSKSDTLSVVIQELKALPSRNTVSLKDKESIDRITGLLEGMDLTTIPQALLDNFNECKARYLELADAKKKADAFLVTLDNMPTLEDLTVLNKENVDNLVKLYDNLNSDSLNYLPVSTDMLVLNYRAKMSELIYENEILLANQMITEIDALLKQQVSKSLLEKIDIIIARYATFNSTQQSLVTNYTNLLALREKVLELSASEHKRLANDIVSAINRLPDVKVLKVTDSDRVHSANNMYATAIKEVQQYVTNYYRLSSLLSRLSELENMQSIIDYFVTRVDDLGSIDEMEPSDGEYLREVLREYHDLSTEVIKALPASTTKQLTDFEKAYKEMMHGSYKLDNPKIVMNGAFGHKPTVSITCDTVANSDSEEYKKLKEDIKSKLGKELIVTYTTTLKVKDKETTPYNDISVEIEMQDFIKNRSGVSVYVLDTDDTYKAITPTLVTEKGVTTMKFDTSQINKIMIVGNKAAFSWIFDWFKGDKTVVKKSQLADAASKKSPPSLRS